LSSIESKLGVLDSDAAMATPLRQKLSSTRFYWPVTGGVKAAIGLTTQTPRRLLPFEWEESNP